MGELVSGVVGEHRIHCFNDRANNCFRKEHLWVRMKGHGPNRNVNEFALASASWVLPEEVVSELFGGDADACLFAEKQAQRLADQWLLWFSTECPKPPQATRLDFLVVHSGPCTADVWTCEVGECG